MDSLQSFRISFLGNPLALIGLATAVYWLGLSYFRSEAWKVVTEDSMHKSYLTRTYKLRNIPSVGPTFPILSYVGTFKFCRDAHNVVETGIQKVQRHSIYMGPLV